MTHSTSTGHRSSRYMILRQLGHGNLTRVFLAALRTQASTELCVLKLMQSELAADDDFRALFLDQAATTLSISHPGLARTLDVVADAGACGLTLEFLEGQTLARLIERLGRSRFPVDMHLHILSQVLAALEYARELAGAGLPEPGFLHRDVCPSNIFITYDGQIKLLGAGFAEATRALEAKLGRPLVDVRYAAPEVLRGDLAGASVDLFGVGMMIWEAVARKARVRSDDESVIIQQRIEGEEPDLESAWPDAPLPMLAICRRALAVNPSERYPKPSALRAALDAYLARASESSDAVLRRLPGLMESLFADEREQMQRFIGSSLQSAIERSSPWLDRGLDADDEFTPHEEEWNAPTSARIPAFGLRANDGAAAPAVSRVEATRAATPPSTPQVRSQSPPPNPAPARAPSNSTLPPGRAASQNEPARELTTGGHQAYSTSLESTPRRRSKRRRLSLDVLGPVALILGSIVAAYSLHRHSLRDRKPEVQQLAIQAEASVLPSQPRAAAPQKHASEAPAEAGLRPPPSSAPVTRRPARMGARALRAAAAAAVDAGLGDEPRVSVPAFFDGRAAASNVRKPAPPLNAEDLPTVDPELSSLQDAILAAAKAHRSARKHKRDKKAKATPASPPVSALPRPIDEADPYTDPRSE
jgi:serine/threonine protein kinase